MERKILIDEIVNFCFAHCLRSANVEVSEVKKNIDKQLQDPAFIESLINTIFIKAKRRKTLSKQNTIDLLIELEKLRLKMEDKN